MTGSEIILCVFAAATGGLVAWCVVLEVHDQRSRRVDREWVALDKARKVTGGQR